MENILLLTRVVMLTTSFKYKEPGLDTTSEVMRSPKEICLLFFTVLVTLSHHVEKLRMSDLPFETEWGL